MSDLQRTLTRRLKVAARGVGLLLAAWAAVVPASGRAAPRYCLPDGAFGAPPAAAVPLTSVQVYMDASASMAGYLRGVTASLRPHEDLLAIVNSFAASRGARASYARFGENIVQVAPGGERIFARAATYDCHHCDNQHSRIDTVLQGMRAPASGRLSLMVTDLWLSSDSYSGSSQVALGQPLAEILRQGRSLGVIGIRAPYAGRIVDLSPKNRAYAGVRERPLFIIAVGSEADVSAFYAALVQSGSPSFAAGRIHYSLFSAQSANPWRAPQGATLHAEGAGATEGIAVPALISGLQQFRYSLGGHGRIVGDLDVRSGIAAGAVWSGPLIGSTQVWRLSDRHRFEAGQCGGWESFPQLRGAWTSLPGETSKAQLSLNPKSAAGLAPGNVYLVTARLGAMRLQSPNPANEWLRAWSFAPEDEDDVVRERPTFFKALNLADLASHLEASVDRVTPPSGRTQVATTFLVKIER